MTLKKQLLQPQNYLPEASTLALGRSLNQVYWFEIQDFLVLTEEV